MTQVLRCLGQRGARALAPLAAFLFISLLLPPVATAQGGLALSGSFYRQEFKLPQGASIETPDVYVVVFNNTGSDLTVRMVTDAPAGVELVLSESEFRLATGGQKMVTIGVRVSDAAVPGEYQLRVTAEAQKAGTGIKLLGAAGQTAKLTVTGEAASVEVMSVIPDGSPIPARVILYRESASGKVSLGSSDTGVLKMRVAPGSYIAEAYMAGSKLAEQSFNLAANEAKRITLEVRTVYFEGFGILPNYSEETKKLVFAEVVYTVNNLFQPFPEAKVVLKVTRNGAALDEIKLVTLAPLEKGRVGLSYNYIPKEGWQPAKYGFKLELWIEDKLYISSKEEFLDLGGGTALPGGINWFLIGGIAGGLLVVLIIVLFFTLRRRAY